jgi:hypothetical protein
VVGAKAVAVDDVGDVAVVLVISSVETVGGIYAHIPQ